jgi:methylated-DNA-[protein]-cysteine S-methyltransferase
MAKSEKIINNINLIFSTPFGDAAIIYREGPFFIIKILLPRANRKDLIESAGRDDWGKPGSHEKARIISGSIIDYFKGRRIQIPWPPWEWMDMSGLTMLQKSVLVTTAYIPYGKLCTYKDIAEAIHRPRAYRFVGTTLANNPFPILIPCHRVIRSDSSFGRFGGGTDLKRKLIELEARHSRLVSGIK